MVKVIKLQKPFPNATLTAAGEAPLASEATATTTTAMATNINASGNQRSAHDVKPIAIRTNAPSRCIGWPEVVAVTVLVIADPSQLCAGNFDPARSTRIEIDQRKAGPAPRGGGPKLH
jgi:hypothetical protein